MTRTRMEKIKAGACVLALAAALAAVPAAGGSYAACVGGENYEGGQDQPDQDQGQDNPGGSVGGGPCC